MNTRAAALILAGGQGSRLGGVDKPLLDLGGRPIIAHILATLGQDIADIAISANADPARYAGFGHPVLDDGALLGLGPLAGLVAGLDWAAARGATALLSVPGDTPFIPDRLATALAPGPTIARSAGQRHFLVGLWPVAMRAALRAFLAEPGRHRVGKFTRRIGARVVDFPAVPYDPFLNVNTADDLAAARRIGAQIRATHNREHSK